MSLEGGFTKTQKDQLNNLLDHRDSIVNNLYHIERILKVYFPEEFELAYQHWIPQIITALYEDGRWLPRGDQTMQKTLNRLLDKSSQKIGQTVQKFI
jgi:hypothetical protein